MARDCIVFTIALDARLHLGPVLQGLIGNVGLADLPCARSESFFFREPLKVSSKKSPVPLPVSVVEH